MEKIFRKIVLKNFNQKFRKQLPKKTNFKDIQKICVSPLGSIFVRTNLFTFHNEKAQHADIQRDTGRKNCRDSNQEIKLKTIKPPKAMY